VSPQTRATTSGAHKDSVSAVVFRLAGMFFASNNGVSIAIVSCAPNNGVGLSVVGQKLTSAWTGFTMPGMCTVHWSEVFSGLGS
jgi:hypothetical protein